MISWLIKNWFIIALIGAVTLGYLFPGLGQAINKDSAVSSACILILCFSIGYTLPATELKKGLLNVRLHIYIQSFIFIIVPLYFLVTAPLVRLFTPPHVMVGIFALSCLPTTVSTCVAMTRQSGGNVVGSTFNSTLANVLGVFITPVILSMLMNNSGLSLTPKQIAVIIKGLFLRMIIPMAAGFAIQQFTGGFLKRIKPVISHINSLLIVLIVYFSFVKASGDPEFGNTVAKLPALVAFLCGSHIILIFMAYYSGRLLRFSPRDIISAIYAGPQKTIALGAPLLSTYFAATPEILGMAMLPILIYHPWQLLVAAVISRMKLMKC
jgi:sodium/bile acid cotransporter 7